MRQSRAHDEQHVDGQRAEIDRIPADGLGQRAGNESTDTESTQELKVPEDRICQHTHVANKMVRDSGVGEESNDAREAKEVHQKERRREILTKPVARASTISLTRNSSAALGMTAESIEAAMPTTRAMMPTLKV